MIAESDLPALLAELRDLLGHRSIEEGVRRLDGVRPFLETLDPATRHAGTLVGLVAQWVDAGFDDAHLIYRLLDRFPSSTRSSLPLIDYLHVRMAEGVAAMSREDFEQASAHFRLVDSLGGETGDQELLSIASFWTGRCLRRMGRYDDALSYTVRGEELALSCGYAPAAAVMQLTRSWVCFQKGRLNEASAILRKAGEALSRTDDFLARGNLQSAYGRIARRQGRYEPALENFERAICEYRRARGAELQLARSLLNIGFVNRLIALDIQKTADSEAASRRGGAGAAARAEAGRGQRQRIGEIRERAREQLQESMAIYTRHGNHRGMAGVHVNQGLLALDFGDLETAAAEAESAFRHGEGKQDSIVMARARTLQCMVENARLEEEIGDPGHHFDKAEVFAREAVDFAGHTQNRRLLARAYIWQGLTHTAPSHGNLDLARRCCEEAATQLKPEGLERQYVWDDLELLKSKVLHSGPVDPVLRAWSNGIVGDKTFQEITEEFARIIVPKVWEREERKVSRVATRLSMSPKKIRRILRAVRAPGAGKAEKE
jgi:tetratricopeptide (TPR) repeat protein